MRGVREKRVPRGKVRCPKCRAAVAASTTTCPHCGATVSSAQALTTIGIVVLAGGLVAAVATAGNPVAIVVALFGVGFIVFGRFL